MTRAASKPVVEVDVKTVEVPEAAAEPAAEEERPRPPPRPSRRPPPPPRAAAGVPAPHQEEQQREGAKSPPRRRYRKDVSAAGKRPDSNAFIKYYSSQYAALRSENPGLAVTALAAIAAKRYRALSPEDKAAYTMGKSGSGDANAEDEDVCFFTAVANASHP